MSNCICGFDKPKKKALKDHKMDCPYRLQNDDVTVSVEYTEEELLKITYALQRLHDVDGENYKTKGLEPLHRRLVENLQVLSQVRSTGKFPESTEVEVQGG